MVWVRRFALLVALVGICVFVVLNYSWVFAKRINGEVIEIERVTEPTAILGNRIKEENIHSFAMAIRDDKGVIHTASGEDRQWSVVKKGYCVEALFYRYPPWDLSKGDTFFNARVISMRDCKTAAPAGEAPSAPAAPAPVGE